MLLPLIILSVQEPKPGCQNKDESPHGQALLKAPLERGYEVGGDLARAVRANTDEGIGNVLVPKPLNHHVLVGFRILAGAVG